MNQQMPPAQPNGAQTLDPTAPRKMKLKEDQFAVYGTVRECLPNTMFRVKVDDSDIKELIGTEILFTLAGKMRLNRIRVMPGDHVQGYVTKYDMMRGKINFRTK